LSAAAIAKTGSELIREMVGPAGSTRNEGDLSWTGPVLEELCRELEELLSVAWAPATWGSPAARQRTAATGA
jgi:hypothetical protein